MNKKEILKLLFITLAVVFFISTGSLMASSTPPAEISIENKGYKKDRKGPVHLNHAKHSTDYKVACTECHHEYEGGKNVWKEGQEVKKCVACHDPDKKDGEKDKLQNAFHKNCKNCHKEVDPSSKKAPSKKCTDCHA